MMASHVKRFMQEATIFTLLVYRKHLALALLKRDDEGIGNFDMALSLLLTCPGALVSKTLALFSLGRCKRVIEYYDKAFGCSVQSNVTV